ncbi:linear amide C-N hydrolase [Xanthobacter sp. DSM 24535]|uniref:linear amide C-N hydrolase n=1 Tax=Roseixanthobacter psychrophilus TaxID=3119917 RepID=UPI003727B440
MCTRTLYVGDDGFAVTGRNMDWKEDMLSNLWVFPAGCARTGAAGANALSWTSKYGSLAVSGYEAGTPDGLNEKGLAANALYLVESDYGAPRDDRPSLSIALWAQYVLDMFASVAEAVAALRADPFNILAPVLPNGAPAALHLAVSDTSGDSAIFEYIGGVLTIHHDRSYAVMTNSPSYDQQLALDAYWKQVGGLVFLPGTNRAADRFARASFLLESLPRKADPHYIRGIPGQSYEHQAIAAVLSLQRAVSVPLGISTVDQPNISSTIWRSICDHRNLVYYFDSATRPNTFWVDLAKLDFTPGTPIRKLVLQNGEVYAGEVSDSFAPAEDLKWLMAG